MDGSSNFGVSIFISIAILDINSVNLPCFYISNPCNRFNGMGKLSTVKLEWQIGIIGIFRVHPAPNSKFIHGF